MITWEAVAAIVKTVLSIIAAVMITHAAWLAIVERNIKQATSRFFIAALIFSLGTGISFAYVGQGTQTADNSSLASWTGAAKAAVAVGSSNSSAYDVYANVMTELMQTGFDLSTAIWSGIKSSGIYLLPLGWVIITAAYAWSRGQALDAMMRVATALLLVSLVLGPAGTIASNAFLSIAGNTTNQVVTAIANVRKNDKKDAKSEEIGAFGLTRTEIGAAWSMASLPQDIRLMTAVLGSQAMQKENGTWQSSCFGLDDTLGVFDNADVYTYRAVPGVDSEFIGSRKFRVAEPLVEFLSSDKYDQCIGLATEGITATTLSRMLTGTDNFDVQINAKPPIIIGYIPMLAVTPEAQQNIKQAIVTQSNVQLDAQIAYYQSQMNATQDANHKKVFQKRLDNANEAKAAIQNLTVMSILTDGSAGLVPVMRAEIQKRTAAAWKVATPKQAMNEQTLAACAFINATALNDAIFSQSDPPTASTVWSVLAKVPQFADQAASIQNNGSTGLGWLASRLTGWATGLVSNWATGILSSVLDVVLSLIVPALMMLGIAIVGLLFLCILAAYPIMGVLALFPGQWTLMLEWAKALIWLGLCFVAIKLGFLLTQSGGFIVWADGGNPIGILVKQLFGLTLVLGSPIFANFLMNPTMAGLSGLAAQASQTVGKAAAMTAGVVTAGLGAAAAGASGSLGSAMSGATKGMEAAAKGAESLAGGSPDGKPGATRAATLPTALSGDGGGAHGSGMLGRITSAVQAAPAKAEAALESGRANLLSTGQSIGGKPGALAAQAVSGAVGGALGMAKGAVGEIARPITDLVASRGGADMGAKIQQGVAAAAGGDMLAAESMLRGKGREVSDRDFPAGGGRAGAPPTSQGAPPAAPPARKAPAPTESAPGPGTSPSGPGTAPLPPAAPSATPTGQTGPTAQPSGAPAVAPPPTTAAGPPPLARTPASGAVTAPATPGAASAAPADVSLTAAGAPTTTGQASSGAQTILPAPSPSAPATFGSSPAPAPASGPDVSRQTQAMTAAVQSGNTGSMATAAKDLAGAATTPAAAQAALPAMAPAAAAMRAALSQDGVSPQALAQRAATPHTDSAMAAQAKEASASSLTAANTALSAAQTPGVSATERNQRLQTAATSAHAAAMQARQSGDPQALASAGATAMAVGDALVNTPGGGTQAARDSVARALNQVAPPAPAAAPAAALTPDRSASISPRVAALAGDVSRIVNTGNLSEAQNLQAQEGAGGAIHLAAQSGSPAAIMTATKAVTQASDHAKGLSSSQPATGGLQLAAAENLTAAAAGYDQIAGSYDRQAAALAPPGGTAPPAAQAQAARLTAQATQARSYAGHLRDEATTLGRQAISSAQQYAVAHPSDESAGSRLAAIAERAHAIPGVATPAPTAGPGPTPAAIPSAAAGATASVTGGTRGRAAPSNAPPTDGQVAVQIAPAPLPAIPAPKASEPAATDTKAPT